MINVIDNKWYSGTTSVGFVLVHDEITNKHCCYVGCATGTSEKYDINFIKDYGAKVEKSVAEAVFNRKLENYKL